MLQTLGQGAEPGRITAAMRAVPRPASAKLLRVALVHDGNVVDERMLPADAGVSVGESEQATFYVAGVALRAVERGGEPRGRVRVGEHLLLWQLCDPPPPRARVPLPAALKLGPFGDIDWMTTFAAAASFLAHFLAVQLVYSDWADPLVDDDRLIDALVVSIGTVPPVPPLELPTAPATAKGTATAPGASAAPRATPAPGSGRGGSGRSTGPARGGGERVSDIAAQLAALDLETVAALGEGPATQGVIGRGELPVRMIDGAVREGGFGRDDDPLRLGRGRPGRAGTREHGLADIGNDLATDDGTGDGGSRPPEAPPAPTSREPVVGDPPPTLLPDAPAKIARARPRFRRCYEDGLFGNPELEGSLTLTLRVGPNGEVTSVGRGGGSGLAAIVPCLVGVAQSIVFDPPGQSATLAVPIVFRRQR
jgi:hypothetical protein